MVTGLQFLATVHGLAMPSRLSVPCRLAVPVLQRHPCIRPTSLYANMTSSKNRKYITIATPPEEERATDIGNKQENR